MSTRRVAGARTARHYGATEDLLAKYCVVSEELAGSDVAVGEPEANDLVIRHGTGMCGVVPGEFQTLSDRRAMRWQRMKRTSWWSIVQ